MQTSLASRKAFTLLVSLGLFVLAQPAWGYVRAYTTKGCNPMHWAQSCIYVTADSGGVPEIALPDVDRIIGKAIASWQTQTREGSFLRLEYLPASLPRETLSDGFQVIKFRSGAWCRPSDDPRDPPICYDPAAEALTTVTYVSAPGDADADGRIIDADIELNAVENYFYDADSDPDPQAGKRKPIDLWNTLAHELGHLQGLEHPCRLGSSDGIPSCARDGTGQPLLDCRDVLQGRATDPAMQAIYETTMYPRAVARETRKRIPMSDDVAGILDTYPSRLDPKLCLPPGSPPTETPRTPPTPPPGGCSAAGTIDTSRTGLLASLWVLFAVARKRKASPRPVPVLPRIR